MVNYALASEDPWSDVGVLARAPLSLRSARLAHNLLGLLDWSPKTGEALRIILPRNARMPLYGASLNPILQRELENIWGLHYWEDNGAYKLPLSEILLNSSGQCVRAVWRLSLKGLYRIEASRCFDHEASFSCKVFFDPRGFHLSSGAPVPRRAIEFFRDCFPNWAPRVSEFAEKACLTSVPLLKGNSTIWHESFGCACSHDCCGCLNGSAAIKRVGSVYLFQVVGARNY